MERLRSHPGKALVIEVEGRSFARLPVPTHVITAEDDLLEVIRAHACRHLLPGDAVFLSERMVSVTQGRSIPIAQIDPSRLALFLLRFVYRSPYGIGLGSPWTMELAIREGGRARILAAAAAAALTKPLGIRGAFYVVAGRRVAAIDGPVPYALPPYDTQATLAPDHPSRLARDLARALGHDVAIVDANDLGVAVLGASSRALGGRFGRALFRDNPIGQGRQQTPICIVREVGAPRTED